MSSSHASGGPVTTGDGAALAALTDVPGDRFAEEFWGRQALLTRHAGDYRDLLSAAAVDELISRRGLRTPFLRMAKDGKTLPESSFTAPAGVGATIADQLDDTAIWRHFAGGATIVLQALQRTWAPIGAFCGDLADELGHPVQANAYVTPAQNRGFDDHYDVHDVFVLQIEGTKRWVIHAPVHLDPLRDQPWTDRREQVASAAREEPVIDTVLEPGDCLYLPRGWLHAAEAQGAVSIHLTLGVHAWTRYAVAEMLMQDALARLRDDPAARASLPMGDQGTAPVVQEVRDSLLAALREADPQDRFRRSDRGTRRPAPLGPLAQSAAVDALDEDGVLRVRDGVGGDLQGDRLQTRVGWLDFAPDEVDAVRALVDGEAMTVADLGLPLARRLMLAGVAVSAKQ